MKITLDQLQCLSFNRIPRVIILCTVSPQIHGIYKENSPGQGQFFLFGVVDDGQSMSDRDQMRRENRVVQL